MDKQSELLIRATLHDMANVLAGIQGILDLTPRERPLSGRDRDRLAAVLEEGLATLSRSRHLALGTLPESLPQEPDDFGAQLEDDLKPLGVIFRRRFEIQVEGEDRWPGLLLREWIRAAARQILPYVQGEVLAIRAWATAEEWRLALGPVSLLPESLLDQPPEKPGDISARYALAVTGRLRIALSCDDGSLSVRIPRH